MIAPAHEPEGAVPRTDRERSAAVLAATLARTTPPAIQERLERLLLDDRELLISLQCQLEQIRREVRLLNDDRILRAIPRDLDSSLLQ